jgi:divinyl chlorophyllide a 8-vinyl-reductase
LILSGEQILKEIKQNSGEIDAVVSCLASRSGIKKEAFDIDYLATLNCMEAGIECGARHFVLLSAVCVRKPLLQFQKAKLKFEAALKSQSSLTYSVVRPTAFFKSVSGQLERLQKGSSFLMFQDSTRCNPIAESDLATYLIDCISDESRYNKVINLGGPDTPMTKIEQGEVSISIILFSYHPTSLAHN